MNDAAASMVTDVLVVGAGPSGATAALALSTYGVSTLCISKYSCFSRSPRAHITNQRTMEVLRHFGEEPRALTVATPNELMGDHVFCTSLSGAEIGRIKTWHTHPRNKAQADLISPCTMVDLPQNELEPILLNASQVRGANIRFDTELVSFTQDDDGVDAILLDKLTGARFAVRARYMVGADGANSAIAAALELPLEGQMDLAANIGIMFDADLTHLVQHRAGVLYWLFQPGKGVGGFPIVGLRMVRPFNRWIITLGRKVGAPVAISNEDAMAAIHRVIGNTDVPIRIEGIYGWGMNRVHANKYGSGRVFCVGDAVHRHPPMNGLGSNTSVQDSFNLAWKLAFVLKGRAGPALLDSYETERMPIGLDVVNRATANFGVYAPVAESLGFGQGENQPELFDRLSATLADPSEEGRLRRAALRKAIDGNAVGFSALGGEHNQFYESAAIVPDERQLSVADPFDDVILGAEAGRRLPHVWLTQRGHRISSLDVCKPGRFSLFTGLAGAGWRQAVASAWSDLDLPIDLVVVGPGEEFEDPYGDFARLCLADERGALLVRPDLFLSWRVPTGIGEPAEALMRALRTILSLDPRDEASARIEQAKLAAVN